MKSVVMQLKNLIFVAILFSMAGCSSAPEDQPVQVLKTTVTPGGIIAVNDTQAKVIDVIQVEKRNIARVQWKCRVNNISKLDMPVRLVMNVSIQDKDGFEIDNFELDTNYENGDLHPRQTDRVIQRTLTLPALSANNLSFCRIRVETLKTDKQKDQEKEQQQHELARKRAAQEAEIARRKSAEQAAKQAELERQQAAEQAALEIAKQAALQRAEMEKHRVAEFSAMRSKWLSYKENKEKEKIKFRYSEHRKIDDEIEGVHRKLWGKLEIGLTVKEVGALLGIPVSVSSSIGWYDFDGGHVVFDNNGLVKSWSGP